MRRVLTLYFNQAADLEPDHFWNEEQQQENQKVGYARYNYFANRYLKHIFWDKG